MIAMRISKGMKVAACVFSILFSGGLDAQIVTTIAGNGTYGFSGDGSAATSAKIAAPAQVVLDASGNVFIADAENHRIRKVSTSGTITTVAGADSAGFSGDGSAATNARLNGPYGLAVDATGNLFIADYYNNRIRKVTASGVIRTYAGTGTAGYSGDGSAATAAKLNGPCGVAVDAAGNVYIADINNGRIRKVNTSGVITTVAGVGTFGNSGDGGQATNAQIATPYGVSLDASGNIYIVDYYYAVVRKVSPSGVITRVAGIGTAGYSGDGGAATSAALRNPLYVAADNSGNLFIADYLNYVVRMVSPSGVISTVAGNGSTGFSGDGGNASSATFTGVACVAVDASGNLYIADESNNRIRKVTANRAPTFINGSSISVAMCENSPAYPLNPFVNFRDLDAGQTLTVSLVSGPSHGSASFSYSTTSTGGVMAPSGLTYTPTSGYSGTDAMTIMVSDGSLSSTAVLHITVNPKPSAASITGSSTVCVGGTTTLSASPSGGFWGSMDGNTRTGSTTGVVTGIAGGASTIYYNSPYNSYGCRTQSRATVTSLGYPTGAVLTGAASICPGASSTMSSSVTGGTWTTTDPSIVSITTGGTVTGMASGTANVAYTRNNGCFSTRNVRPVRVNGATTLGLIGGPSVVVMPATIALTNPVAGGSWSSTNTSVANISSGGVVTGVAYGLDTIIYSYTNACGITSSVFTRIRVYTSGGKGAGENDEIIPAGNTPNVYPNPTTGLITVEAVTGPVSVVVTDLAGKVVTTKNSDTNKAELDMSQLAKGVYLLNVTAGNEKFVNKILVD